MQTPYLIIGAVVVLWAILIALVRFPTGAPKSDSGVAPKRARFGELLRNRRFMFSVVAQFSTWVRRSASGVI